MVVRNAKTIVEQQVHFVEFYFLKNIYQKIKAFLSSIFADLIAIVLQHRQAKQVQYYFFTLLIYALKLEKS
jgi:hypothetical protein